MPTKWTTITIFLRRTHHQIRFIRKKIYMDIVPVESDFPEKIGKNKLKMLHMREKK